jgi:hypothetical protein
MSVESDTMHYYAQLDREQAMDEAFESAKEDALCEVYDKLTELAGEPLAEAVTSEYPYTGDELLALLKDARKHTDALLTRRANDKIARV